MNRTAQQREHAARLVAQGKLKVAEIAKKVGVSQRTIGNWKAEKAFNDRVAEIPNEWRARANSQGIADLDETLRDLQDRHKRCRVVIQERARDPEMNKAPGGKTGLLTVTYKLRSLGGEGGGQEEVPEYSVDTALLREMRDIEVQIHTHLGSWKRRIEYSDNSKPKLEPAQIALTVTFIQAKSDDGCPIPGQAGVSVPTPPL